MRTSGRITFWREARDRKSSQGTFNDPPSIRWSSVRRTFAPRRSFRVVGMFQQTTGGSLSTKTEKKKRKTPKKDPSSFAAIDRWIKIAQMVCTHLNSNGRWSNGAWAWRKVNHSFEQGYSYDPVTCGLEWSSAAEWCDVLYDALHAQANGMGTERAARLFRSIHAFTL